MVFTLCLILILDPFFSTTTIPYSTHIVHLMGQWCGGHFHIHYSEEASFLEYLSAGPWWVSNASSELNPVHMWQLVVSMVLARVYGLPERLSAHANTVCCMIWANDPSLNCLVRNFLRHLVDFLRITLGMRGIGFLRKAFALIWGLFHGDIWL